MVDVRGSMIDKGQWLMADCCWSMADGLWLMADCQWSMSMVGGFDNCQGPF